MLSYTQTPCVMLVGDALVVNPIVRRYHPPPNGCAIAVGDGLEMIPVVRSTIMSPRKPTESAARRRTFLYSPAFANTDQ
ncbi:hypothetical protein CBM2592_A90162 [Cupriavidus taiwanensis]|nr:hypothetical protein CBM2592_A90162 [Cupriavidus taiwanensis]SOY90817.1 hypothetical protein CBM2591_A90161 [Cupriavidus taiwanensis]SOZ63605.1 hypothetical protein CBM2617_A70139 [Cupriavidus taiwanensis]SOZ84460.1 hypothetical protein CBM2622_A80139 [Cupriavidus taiwanensis]SPA17085.1 hypothetical protein CBM2631_A90161 [Cupriavidus taiwanensis]